MKVIRPRDDALVAERRYSAVIESVVQKQTRKGKLKFLRCRVASPGDYKGREVDYLIPRFVPKKSSFHQFLVSVLGPLEVGMEVDPERLVGEACVIDVKHVTRKGRAYANVAMVSAPEGEGIAKGSAAALKM
jgi:hypothetical protein